MAETEKIEEEFKKIVMGADGDTILKLQKIMLDRITGPGGGVAIVSTGSCDVNSC